MPIYTHEANVSLYFSVFLYFPVSVFRAHTHTQTHTHYKVYNITKNTFRNTQLSLSRLLFLALPSLPLRSSYFSFIFLSNIAA